MNSKSTNRWISILNIIYVLSFIVFNFYVTQLNSAGHFNNSALVHFDNIMSSFTLINITFILIAVINFVNALQNNQNKKLMFWYIIFSFYCITQLIGEASRLGDILDILWGIVPIVYAIRNIIINIKKKENKINLILYFLIILYSIILLMKNFEIINITIYHEIWAFIAIIMQLIYIRKQETNIEITNIKKIINILFYRIFFSILILLSIFIYGWILSTFYGESNITQFLEDITVNLSNFNDTENIETYIKVQNNTKWGYLDQYGNEIIPCKYDSLTSFYEINIASKKYIIALAQENHQYFIITNQNETINIPEDVITNFKDLVSDNEESIILYITQLINSSNSLDSSYNSIDDESKTNGKIVLEENQDGTYTYRNDNNTSYITFERYYPSDIQPDIYNISVNKNTSPTETYFEYIPSTKYTNSIEIYTYSDGYIPFYNYESKSQGWYNQNAEKIQISGNYQILDVKNNIITLRTYDKENVYFLNFQGEILSQAKEVVLYNEGYLIRKDNEKISFLDNNLLEITQEYNYIIPIFDYNYNKLIMLLGLNITESGDLSKSFINLQGNILTDKSYEYIDTYDYQIDTNTIYSYRNGNRIKINFEDELISNSVTDNIPYNLTQ